MELSSNTDVCSERFYEPILVTDFVEKYCKIKNPEKDLSQQDCMKIKKALIGVYVKSKVDNCRYKIKGFSCVPLSKLRMVGQVKDVVDYYMDEWNISIERAHWPAVESGNAAKPIYLPMEVCEILKMQWHGGNLTLEQARLIIDKKNPTIRMKDVEQVVRCNNCNQDEVSSNFKIQVGNRVSNSLVSVDARVLPAPELKFARKKVDPHMGTWSIIDQKLHEAKEISKWTCINFSSQTTENVERFCGALAQKCKSFGMTFDSSPMVPVVTANSGGNIPLIRPAISALHGKSKDSQLLIVVLPDGHTTSFYKELKRTCDILLGITSQCCTPEFVKDFYGWHKLTSLAMKINAKVGGRSCVLNEALNYRIPYLADAGTPTIVFGADVTHPEKNDESPSIAAVVASMDWPEVTKYKAVVFAQNGGEEIIRDIGDAVRVLLEEFSTCTGLRAGRIIFYRDGVSDCEFGRVLLEEVEAIREAYKSVHGQDVYIPVTFVVVKKRHKIRLSPIDPAVDGANVKAGTVVDSKISNTTGFNFFLNSHEKMGTSKPNHYCVLHDDTGFSAGELQRLTNDLCYSCLTSTRAVSLVPPVHYAHQAAYRARCHGMREDDPTSLPAIHAAVRDKMFFC